MNNPAKFIKAGKAIFTVQNTESGNRFTYKVKRADENKDVWFVSVLNGPDNYSNYRYMGCLFGNEFKQTKNSKVSADATSFKAFGWTWNRLLRNALPENVHIHHEGRCGRCGRKLTVPESIESGFGPECINHV